MIRGTTESGFEYEICDEALDDYELLEVLAEIDAGHSGQIPLMVKLLLGEEQTKALKEHCKRNGRVTASKMLIEVTEILSSNKAGKN